MTVSTDFTFPSDYTCELLDELPASNEVERYFFGGGRDGILVRVTPRGRPPWIGTFAFGVHRTGISRILGMPEPRTLCVVARGAGYLVPTDTPASCEPVKAVPIMDARAAPGAGVVVFANLTELVAYGAEGLRWRTKRLAWDGFKVVEVTPSTLVGELWDLREDAARRFEVDLSTGAHRGGMED